MAPKGIYTAELLRAFGTKATGDAAKRFPDCVFACNYTGGDGAVSKRSQVRFEWQVSLGQLKETCSVEVNCLNAERRGVPFPEQLHIAIPCARLHDRAFKAAAEAQSSVVSPSCVMLGVPAPALVPLAGTTLVPGAVVHLQSRTLARQDFLLAAHIDGDRRAVPYFEKGRISNLRA